MTGTMTRGDRLRDAIALLLVVLAVAPVAYAWRGFVSLSDEARIVLDAPTDADTVCGVHTLSAIDRVADHLVTRHPESEIRTQ